MAVMAKKTNVETGEQLYCDSPKTIQRLTKDDGSKLVEDAGSSGSLATKNRHDLCRATLSVRNFCTTGNGLTMASTANVPIAE
jgi:hypothetical protein